MIGTKKWKFLEELQRFPKTYEFLEKQRIIGVEKLDSLWRKENILLRISCESQDYVLKIIKGKEKESELDRIRLMSQEYPCLMPSIFLFEGNSYLMEHIKGNSFFSLDDSERTEKINLAGRVLKYTYSQKTSGRADISRQVFNSFSRYREKRKRFFSEQELRIPIEFFRIFQNVPAQVSHNDLNAANLLYGKEIKLIDPSEEGFEDISRDIGRYCASCFFNYYDYFGNNLRKSLDIANAFLCNFDEESLKRAQYFIGESFLSFLNFDTVSVEKSVLKKLAITLLQEKGNLINLLEKGLK